MKLHPKILLLSLVFILSACYTSKQADKQLNKAQINFPELVAKKTSLWYPCERFKGTSDSSEYKVFIKQIDSLNQLKIDSIFIYDTLSKVDTLIKNIKDCQEIVWKYRRIYTQLPAIHDTVIMVSTADKYTIQQMINEREEAHKRYDRSSKMNIYFLIALIVSLLLHIFRKK